MTPLSRKKENVTLKIYIIKQISCNSEEQPASLFDPSIYPIGRAEVHHRQWWYKKPRSPVKGGCFK